MKQYSFLNRICFLFLVFFSFTLYSCGDGAASSTETPTEEVNTADYPLVMEKMVVYENKEDPTTASTYENIAFLGRSAFRKSEHRLSDGTTIPKITFVLSNVEAEVKKAGDIQIKLDITNAGKPITAGTYTTQHDCEKCPELASTSNNFWAVISHYSDENGIIPPMIGTSNEGMNTQLEIARVTDKEIAGSFDIVDKKTNASFKGTFTLPLIEM